MDLVSKSRLGNKNGLKKNKKAIKEKQKKQEEPKAKELNILGVPIKLPEDETFERQLTQL